VRASGVDVVDRRHLGRRITSAIDNRRRQGKRSPGGLGRPTLLHDAALSGNVNHRNGAVGSPAHHGDIDDDERL
jgi:hypothetical protein